MERLIYILYTRDYATLSTIVIVYTFTIIAVYFHQSMLALFLVFMVRLLLRANGRGLTHWKLENVPFICQ